jgi:3-isopropylmalate/(R)-2-methylmalate dehydratase small subunit
MKTHDIIESSLYVLGDNINTDEILTAEFMKINPGTPEGYKALGKLAMCGLSDEYPPFVDQETGKALHQVIVAGSNFGCGSSREHAPIALGSSGVKVVLAKSFARIFYRNCIATGEIFPIEIENYDDFSIQHGEKIKINFDALVLTKENDTNTYKIKDFGDLSEIVNAGGLFPYARKKGMI